MFRALIGVTIALALHGAPGTARCATPAVRVMTFNVLHDGVRTFMPSWRVRRNAVAKVILSARPDVACLQEVSPRQLEDLSDDLAEYQVFPGRLSGGTTLTGWARMGAFFARLVLGDFYDHGEHCPILIRRGSGAPLDSGSFLLTRNSPTPHVVNWVRIRLPSETTLDVLNTHLGLARGRTRDVPEGLLEILDERRAGAQILAGDFNALPSSPLLRSLTRDFRDAGAGARGGTLHWGPGLPGPRLDYVLVRPPCAVDSARTVRGPSDHDAVVTDLRLGD